MWLDMISAKDLEQYVGRSDCLIVDLRSTEEYKKSHVPKAVNIPYQELNTNRLPKDKTVILYCQRGSLSLAACRRLKERGFRAISVNGGFSAYTGKMQSSSANH